jgi:SH3 domain protein
VKSGDQVELLEEGDSWARVRLKNGIEGWMPKRFLAGDAPPFKRVQMLQAENERIQQQNRELNKELTELRELHLSSDSELSTCIARRDTIQADYQRLRTDTADVIAIQEEMAATKKEIESVRAVFAEVEQQNKELKRKTAVTWFLAGGGMILIGWIIGLITCRSRKRRQSLL